MKNASKRCQHLSIFVLLIASFWRLVSPPVIFAADDAAAVEARLASAVQYLASEELEGRGVGTRGLDLAADYIASEFAAAGLGTKVFDGTPFQRFTATSSSRLGDENRLAFVRPLANGAKPERMELKPGADFTPMSPGIAGPLDLPLVFVGYGITAAKEGYDDYAGLDVKGKAVVVLRHEPQQKNPKSVFNGTEDSAHAPLVRKIANAAEHGAGAVIFCTDDVEIAENVDQARGKWQEALDRVAEAHAEFKQIQDPSLEQIETQRAKIETLIHEVDTWSQRLRTEMDPLLAFDLIGAGGARPKLAVLHCRRSAMDKVVRVALETDLASLERTIDLGPTPHSRVLDGWRAVGRVEIEQVKAPVKNVVGVLEGRGPKADETIVIGAHYDHLGWGGPGSLAAGQKVVHPGADDNASGVAVVLEIARQLAGRPEKPARRLVFVAFTGEERGMYGSSHYVKNPLFPLEKTIAMVNLDMVGRLKDGKLTVGGAGSAERFGEILDEANQRYGFRLTKQPSGYGPSDHMVFYSRGVPVLHFYTGSHSDYHRPSDVFEKVNLAGMRQIEALVTDVILTLAGQENRPKYVAMAPPKRIAGRRPYLGTIPDFSHEGPGYGISGVAPGGPAELAGLRSGDAIIAVDGRRIGSLDDIDAALREHKAGDRLAVVVQRDGKELKFEISLGDPR